MLNRIDFDSSQWKESPEYQFNTVSEAISKLSYEDDPGKRNQERETKAGTQNWRSSDLEKVEEFNKNGLNLVKEAYNKMSNEAKNDWATNKYKGFYDETSPTGVNRQKLESWATRSSTHAAIAKDFESRIKAMVKDGSLKVLA